MAAPPEVTMQGLTGYWTMSKTLSDPFDGALTLQGVPWIVRKIATLTTLSVHVTQEVDDSGLRTFIFDQSISMAIGGLKGEKEIRVLDWREEVHTSPVFGTTAHRSRLINLKTATDPDGKSLHHFLTEGFLEEGKDGGDNFLYDFVVHKMNGWVVHEVWGFGIVNDERYFIRKTMVKKGDEIMTVRALYEWKGKTKSG